MAMEISNSISNKANTHICRANRFNEIIERIRCCYEPQAIVCACVCLCDDSSKILAATATAATAAATHHMHGAHGFFSRKVPQHTGKHQYTGTARQSERDRATR